MMNSLLFDERADALIALAIVFEGRFPDERTEPGLPLSDNVRRSFDAFDESRLKPLLSRSAKIALLSDSKRKEWLGRWIDNIRRRGRAVKLDPNVHPEQVAKILRKEPHAIRRHIFDSLPPELRDEAAFLLHDDEDIHDTSSEYSSAIPPDEIIELVKDRFLSNFVQTESIHDADSIDQLSSTDLPEFIHQLGLREIAVACRGINSKEALASFFCRFAEDDAKAIAIYLSTMEKVDSAWVASADGLVKRAWNRRLRTRQILHMIGLELLASAFAQRTDTAIRNTAQKLPYRDSVRWGKMISAWRERLADGDERSNTIERKRAKMIKLMASKFRDSGNV